MADKYYVKSDNPVAVPAAPLVGMTITGFLRTLVIGAIVGFLSTGVYLLLNKFIFAAALCRTGVEGCANAPMYSTIITAVIAVIIGIVALAKYGVYRPLLIALAAPAALWTLYAMIGAGFWLWALLIGTVFYAVAYVLFAWVGRVRSFILATILLVAIVVLVRVVLG